MAEVEEEKFVSPWKGSNEEFALGERTVGGDVLEFGLDTAEVVGIGATSVLHGTANLAEGVINTLTKAPSPHSVLPIMPSDTPNLLNHIDDDIQEQFPDLKDMSDEKMLLGHMAGFMFSAVGVTNAVSKVNQVASLLKNGSLTTRLATRVAVGGAGDVAGSIIVPNRKAGNFFDFIAPESEGILSVMNTEGLEEGSIEVMLKNAGADIFAGVAGQILLDGLVGAYKVIGKSDVTKAHRAKLMADLLDDSNLSMTRNWMRDQVDGFSIMADKAMSRPNVTTHIDPINPKEFEAMGDTYATLKVKENQAMGNIKLKTEKELKHVDQEMANSMKRIELEKNADLKVLNRDREILADDVMRQEVKLQGDAPKAEQGKATNKKSRARYNQQVKTLEADTLKKTEALDARELAIMEQAESSHKVVGDTTEAVKEAIQRKADNELQKVNTTTDKYRKYIDEDRRLAKELDEVDIQNTVKSSTHEEVDQAVASTVRDGVDEPVDQLNKTEKVRKSRIDKEKRTAINKGIEVRVKELEVAVAEGKFTPDEKDLAEKFLKSYNEGHIVVNSKGEPIDTLRTGKQARKDVSNILNFFGRELDTVKKVIKAEDNVKYINDVLKNGVTDELTKALDQLSKLGGLDRETLLLNMNSWGVVVQESAHVVTAIYKHLDEAIDESIDVFGKLKKRLDALPEKSRNITAEETEAIIQSMDTLQSLTSGVGGIGSGQARGLRAHGSGYGSYDVGEALDGVRSNLNIKKPSVVAGKANSTKKTLLDDMMRNLDVKDQKQLQKFINEMATKSKEEFVQAVTSKTKLPEMFNDLFRVHGLLGMISAPATVGRVWGWTFMQFGFDQIITKNIESILATVGRASGITQGGARFDNIARAKAIVDVMGDYMKYWKGDKDALGSIGRTATDYSDRSLASSPKEIYDHIHKAIDVRLSDEFKDVPYLSSAVTRVERITSAPMAMSMWLSGRSVRTMEMGDHLFRRLTAETEFKTSAISMFRNKGGKAFFGDSMDETTFIKRYMTKAKQYDALKDELTDKKISQLEFTDKTTELFKGHEKLLEDISETSTWAHERALRITQQEDTAGTITGAMIRGMNQSTKGNDPVAVMGRFVSTMIIPFQKSPVNSLRTAVEMTPLAVTSKRWWEDISKGTTKQKINALSKTIAGTTLMYTVGEMVADGYITGSAPKGSYKDFENKQWQPMSIRHGDSYYSYAGSPFAVLLGTVADHIRHGAKEDDPDAEVSNAEKANMALFSIFMNVTANEQAFKSMSDFMESIRTLDIDRTATSIAGKVDPFVTFGQGLAKVGSDYQQAYRMESTLKREQDDLLGVMHRALSQTTRNSFMGNILKTEFMDSKFDTYDRKLDVMGQPIAKYGNSTMNALLSVAGLRNVSMDAHPLRAELVRLGLLSSSNSPSSVMDIEMDSNMDKNLRDNVWNGNGARKGLVTRLSEYMETPEYQGATLGPQKKAIGRMIEMEKQWYKTQMYNTSEELRNKVKRKARTKLDKELTRGTAFSVKAEEAMHFATTTDLEVKAELQKEGKEVLKVLSK